MTVDGIGAAHGVHLTGPAWPNEAHRHGKPGFVERHHTADEDVSTVRQRREPGGDMQPSQRRVHRIVVDKDGPPRGHVAESGVR